MQRYGTGTAAARLTTQEKLGVAVGLYLVLNNLSFFPSTGALYYVVMGLSLVYLMATSRGMRFSGIMIWLYTACFLSIIFNKVPSLFSPYQRLASFFIVTSLLFPFIISDTFTKFRSQVFVTVLSLLRYVIVCSFVMGLLHMGYNLNYFQGITNHSMLLGPFSAMSVLYSLFNFLPQEQTKKKKMLYAVILLCALFCLLQAASRTAFIACLVSAMLFLALYFRRNLGRYVKVVACAVAVVALSFPLWIRYMDKLEEKNNGDTSLSFDSRAVYWQTRVEEFESSPLIGIGFSSVDIDNEKGSNFNAESGQVESGSSWLSALSMTGLLGGLALVSVFVSAIAKAWKLWTYTPLLSSFLISLSVFWIFHMMAEGYIFAGGSTMAFCVWILLGIIYGVSENKELAYELQRKLCK